MKAPRSFIRPQIIVNPHDVCSRCLSQSLRRSPSPLQRPSIHTRRKLYRTTPRTQSVSPQTFMHDFFSANTIIDRGWLSNPFIATTSTLAAAIKPNLQQLQDSMPVENGHRVIDQHDEDSEASGHAQNFRLQHEELPLHRKKRLKSDATQSQDVPLPLDASSQLTTAATSLPRSARIRRNFATYLSLAKPRLSFLILLTTTSAYSLYPIPDILSSHATTDIIQSTLSTSTLTLFYLTSGTFLSCASANTLNMLFEPQYDALMARTRNRPLVRNLIKPRSALIFAALTGSTGLALLHFGTNPTVAALSALNIFLYAGVYTPMKRLSWWNTWAGAIVGAIPPLMGWAAAAGQTATVEHHSWQDLLLAENAVGGWLLAALLFAWQFPHFNSLSHGIREDYKRAGHKMLCWLNPARNGRVALRYSLLMFPICTGLWWAGYVNGGFLVLSSACNSWMTTEAFRFWRSRGAGGSARGLFWASVWQLPLVLIGALVCKVGFWERFLRNDDEGVQTADEEFAARGDGDRDESLISLGLARRTGAGLDAETLHEAQ